MKYKEYDLVNEDKLHRAIHGNGHVTGVGEKATEEEKVAAYDKIGGLIMKGKDKVALGSFYDFAKRKPRETPDVHLVYRVPKEDGNTKEVKIKVGKDLPIEIKAAKIVEKTKEVKASKSKK